MKSRKNQSSQKYNPTATRAKDCGSLRSIFYRIMMSTELKILCLYLGAVKLSLLDRDAALRETPWHGMNQVISYTNE